MIAQLTQTAQLQNVQSLLTALRSLDYLLQNAIAQAKVANGTEPFTDPYRGLYVTQEQSALSLEREPGEPSWQNTSGLLQLEEMIQDSVVLTQLQQTFQLSSFEIAVVLIAIAPEIDLRYERIYAYLQDDITRKRPTIELALNLLCSTAMDKLHYRHCFTVDVPLIHHGILNLIADANQIQPPLLAHYLKLDEQITHFLMGSSGLDQRLQPFSTLVTPTITLEQLPLSAVLQQTLKPLCNRVREASLSELISLKENRLSSPQPLHLYFQDGSGLGSRVAGAIAHSLNRSLLTVDLRIANQLNIDLESTVRLLCREAQIQNAIAFLPGIDELLNAESRVLNFRLLEILREYPSITILSGQASLPPALSAEMVTIALPLPDFAQRQTYWQTQLSHHGISLDQQAVSALSDRFRLTPDQIDRAISTACTDAIHHIPGSSRLPFSVVDSLFSAARQQSGQELQGLANKLTPRYTWSDIVLAEEALEQLKDICNQVKHRSVADRANAILFFDEADALFGKRSEVNDAHDRYANLEVGYLLQKMEEYTGVSVLATNLRQNIDDAFLRRIQAIIEFPFPDEASRHHLWQVAFPAETPLDSSVDFEALAQGVRLAGGNIKNIAWAAAFSAASEGKSIGMSHLLKAAQREYQKSGRSWEGSSIGC